MVLSGTDKSGVADNDTANLRRLIRRTPPNPPAEWSLHVKYSFRAAICPALLCPLLLPSISASDGWSASYEEAIEKAEQEDLPVLLHFYAPWCGPCRRMEQETFANASVQKELDRGLVAVEVDVSSRQDLASDFGVSSVPRDIVVYPGQEPKLVATGFQSSGQYISLLRKISAKGRTLKSQVSEDKTDRESLLGLKGFCPVTLIRDRAWKKGDQALETEYRGVKYRFSSAKSQQQFEENPRRYTPQNLGCDPVVLFRDQKAVTGMIRHGVFFDNRLYLFQTEKNKVAFKKNPLQYTRIRHAVRVDDLAGQRYQ